MKQTELKVMGMTCPSCVVHIRGAMKEVDGVTDVDVRLRDGLVVVTHETSVPESALAGAVREAGYEVAPAA